MVPKNRTLISYLNGRNFLNHPKIVPKHLILGQPCWIRYLTIKPIFNIQKLDLTCIQIINVNTVRKSIPNMRGIQIIKSIWKSKSLDRECRNLDKRSRFWIAKTRWRPFECQALNTQQQKSRFRMFPENSDVRHSDLDCKLRNVGLFYYLIS